MKSGGERSRIWTNESGAEELLFGSVKEDALVEIALLARHGSARRAAVTASGGCTVLSIAATTPVQHLAALDINPAQIQASKLKLASVLHLNPEEARLFNLVDGSQFYERLRPVLEPDVAAFWDRRRTQLRHGLNQAGSVDRRMFTFRRLFHRFIHSPEFVRRFLSLHDLGEQQDLFDRSWANWRWKVGTRLAFEPILLKALFSRGANIAFPADFVCAMRKRVRRAFIGSPVRTNPYLWSTFLGDYGETSFPYLQAKGIAMVQENHANIQFETSDFLGWLRHADSQSIDFFALSNILETATEEDRTALAVEAARTARIGAILVIRSIIPAGELILKHPKLHLDPELTAFATEVDRSCFCNIFQIYRRW
jgi:S-adenosylmethionine:diacylglycerol 3-amino-3-carboxypropyl transferase